LVFVCIDSPLFFQGDNMTPLSLILIIVALFGLLLTYETAGDDTQTRFNPSGLFTWLISGNWPAKVGAGLVIIGVGALLRYAFANIDVPPEMKLAGGAIVAAILGFAAMLLRNQPKRRAIYLALGGAAFGVAYLTAYSAYGIFNYINNVNALALLAMVSVAAGVFAVTSNAMSVAILAMVGAYIAPKFAIGTPGVLSVYGYYLAASILSLIMVTLRGWRPLIHLSFLFTLAGALFFGWNGKFYEPAYYSLMQPMLLALTAVHLVMPLLERKHIRSAALKRFDWLYFILLPLVAAGLTLKIAPDLHVDGAIGLGALALLWAAAAAGLYLLKQNEISRHAVVALLLALAAVFCYAKDLPWSLIGLVLSVMAMAIAPKLNWPRNTQDFACGAATLFGVLHVIYSITQPTPSHAFLSEVFAYRMIASALMLYGAWIGTRQAIAFAKILGIVGIIWAVLSICAELLRLHIDFLPQLAYGLILGAIVLSILFSDKAAAHPVVGGVFIFALICCGWWAVSGSSSVTVIAYLVLTPAALLGMAWSGRDTERKNDSDFSPSMAIGLLPFALLPWASATADHSGITTDFFEAFIAMTGIAVAGLSARLWLSDSPRWNDRIQPLHVYFAAFALLWVTLFHIERGIWPIGFELLALVYLIAYVTRRSREQAGVGFGVGAIMVLSVALVLQAMLLRAFGPDQAIMDASDINKMHLRAVVSLMWTIFGASLAWWGTHTKSRSVWSAGSVLLIVAAVKLVLFDFGDLGQLGNIFAFIAAGVIFLGVAWFAPIPPKAESVLKPAYEPEPQAYVSPAQKQATSKEAAQPEQPSRPQSQEAAATRAAATTAVGIEHPVAAMQRSERKRPTSTSRYREEPASIHWLWLALLMIALSIALFFSAWQKHTRHQRAMQQYRQQLAEYNNKVRQQQIEADNATQNEHASASDNGNEAIQSAAAQPALQGTVVTPKRPIRLTDACTNFTDQLPSDYVLYAAGDYKGRETTLQTTRQPKRLPPDFNSVGTFDVSLDVPGKKVVLALGAYEPSLWKIRWTSETTIAGILVSGYHEQTIMNLSQSIPVLNATHDSKSPCGYFYLKRDNLNQTDAFMNRIFGRSAQIYMQAMNGRIDFGGSGSGTSTSPPSNAKIERYVDENGHVGYRQAVEEK
jgi:uncharacterized membrane protein